MTNYETVDFFMDDSLIADPYPYFEYLRSQCPVVATPHYGVVAVSGYDEATEVYRNLETFSSCISVIGPFATFPEPLEGDDVSELIERQRDQLPMNEHMVTMDPPMHTQERALLMRLLTPKRLKENEAFMWRAVDRQLDEFIADGHCEFISAYAQPFAMLAVADVLGVPEDGPPGSPPDLRIERHPREDRRRARPVGRGRRGSLLAQPAVVSRRLVHQVHRGPSGEPAPRRADRPRPGQVPGRVDP